ncbi:MAG: RNA methyltransferase [Desulfobacteraceae bacterium]|jgi:putative N6-adenine-specific DNA methylase
MNIEKQLKRHLIGPRQTFFASVLPGFESVCRQELETLADTVEIVGQVHGGIVFSGRLADLYRANLHLRTAGRILMRIAQFKATNFRRLAKHLGTISWHLYLPSGTVPQATVASHHSRLYHSDAVAQRLQETIEDFWRSQAITPRSDSKQNLYIRFEADIATLSIDSSGEALHRRGIKSHEAEAPLRETTAAAILLMAGFENAPGTPLLDPMCGSGTFSLEAALMRKRIAPGLFREFAFMQWPAFRPRQWDYLKSEATKRIESLEAPQIHASDLSPDACLRLETSVHHASLADAITVRNADFFQLPPVLVPESSGLIVLNPPYGRRLETGGAIKQFYQRIDKKVTADFEGWQAALVVPHRRWLPGLAGRLASTPLNHGGLRLSLLIGRV